MPTAINKILDGFLFPTISPIIGAPNYENIAEVHLKSELERCFRPIEPWMRHTRPTSPHCLPRRVHNTLGHNLHHSCQPRLQSHHPIDLVGPQYHQPLIRPQRFHHRLQQVRLNRQGTLSNANRRRRQDVHLVPPPLLRGIQHHHHPLHFRSSVHGVREDLIGRTPRQRRQTLSAVRRQLAHRGINRPS